MKLVVDANILVRLVVGRRAPVEFAEARRRGVYFFTTYPQLEESRSTLVRVFGIDEEPAITELIEATAAITLLEDDEYAAHEDAARVRLHAKAQPDWPVLAAAMALGFGIWSDDRDFFGVGVPVWSSQTIGFARFS